MEMRPKIESGEGGVHPLGGGGGTGPVYRVQDRASNASRRAPPALNEFDKEMRHLVRQAVALLIGGIFAVKKNKAAMRARVEGRSQRPLLAGTGEGQAHCRCPAGNGCRIELRQVRDSQGRGNGHGMAQVPGKARRPTASGLPEARPRLHRPKRGHGTSSAGSWWLPSRAGSGASSRSRAAKSSELAE